MTHSRSRWLVLSAVLLALGGVVALAFFAAGLVKLLVVCALLAYILDPLASYFESLGLNRTKATVIVFVGLAGLFVGMSVLLYPVLEQELQAMQGSEYAKQANDLVARVEQLIRAKFAFLGWGKVNLTKVVQNAESDLGKNFSGFLFSDLAATIAHLVAIPFIIFFLLKDGRDMKKRLISLVPNRYFEFSLHLIYKMDCSLGNFLRGQFLDAVIFGALTTLALWFLRVDYFLFIGCFAGLANLVPYVGPIAGASLAIGFVLLTTGDLKRVSYVLLAFLCIKLVDDTLIQPLTVAKSVKMHPLLILLVIILGGRLFGIFGMLLAVPVTGFVKVGWEACAQLLRKYRHSRLMEAPLKLGK